MPRTQEQVAADQALTKAIQGVLEAYEVQEDYLLSDYMVICTQARIDEEGDAETAYSYLYRDSNLPTHAIMGMLEMAQLRIRSYVHE